MKRTLFTVVGLALLMQACATMSPDYEEPTVTLTSIRAIESEGMTPSFEVGLRIINPNRDDLAIEGIVYTIALEGHEVVKGVGKDYPVVEAYSQQDITLLASVNLLSGLRLMGDLMRAEAGAMRYEFTAKLDPGGFYPSIRVSETGQLDLGASPR